MQKRYELLAELINSEGYKVGAEIGCRRGDTTGYILKNCPELIMIHAVDAWRIIPKEHQTDYYKKEDKRLNFPKVFSQFKANIRGFEDKVDMLRGLSWEQADNIPDNSLDFIFIDADHAYESVLKDLNAWIPKVRQGGLLSGHDIHMQSVQDALNEVGIEYDIQVDNVWYSYK